MHERVTEGVYLVGGGGLSSPSDCLVYGIDAGEPVLLDCGCGPGWRRIRGNLAEVGLDDVRTLVLTHAHVDHVGAAAAVQRDTGCSVVAHDLDADAIETGDEALTAAGWYGLTLDEMRVDRRIHGPGGTMELRGATIHLVHTPGHTPGSMIAWMDAPGGRVLFGQDIHGPFSASFGSDIAAWRRSMRLLLDLEADILCEGHYGIFRGRDRVRSFIEEHLSMNR